MVKFLWWPSKFTTEPADMKLSICLLVCLSVSQLQLLSIRISYTYSWFCDLSLPEGHNTGLVSVKAVSFLAMSLVRCPSFFLF